MIAGLAAAADLISSWSEEEDEEEEEGSQLRRMRDRLAQSIEVLTVHAWFVTKPQCRAHFNHLQYIVPFKNTIVK